MLAEVYRMLVLNLGEPPRQFEWRHEDPNSKPTAPKSYTPRNFYEEFVGVELGDYVNVFSDPSKEYGKHYEIRMTSNIQGGRNVRFVNVRPEVLKAAALKSVLANEPVWFACDVGKDQSREHGIMALDMYDYEAVYGVDLSMTKAQRSLYRESVPNHAMVFVGVDMKDETPVKWLVENSWGTDRGSKGYWAMYDGWFDVNVYCSVLKKDYIPDDVLKAFEQPVIQLPVWDPMWSFVN
ncbi:MAG TPA: aminopeptidase, partial [Phycisphaerales bacterium]|nr:aminopeptidase [Phycisphaerales bacterium]